MTLMFDGAVVVDIDQVIDEWFMVRFVDGTYTLAHWSELAVIS